MIFRPPFFHSPFYRPFPPPYYEPQNLETPPVDNIQSTPKPQANKAFSDNNISSKTRKNTSNNSQYVNILGITLQFDDILLICLLLFLYTEGVQDEMLFVVLILLLLS